MRQYEMSRPAGPAFWRLVAVPMNRPVPMTPPMAIIWLRSA